MERKLNEEDIRFHDISLHYSKYVFGYGFLYCLFLFFLFKMEVIRDIFILNWMSNVFSYFIPLIDIYAHKYNYYTTANLYSILILGVIFLTYRSIVTKWKSFSYFFEEMRKNYSNFGMIFKRMIGLLFFGFILWICLSEVFVSVQYTCPEKDMFSRECLGMRSTPSESNVHHLLLMVIITLFWGLFILFLISPLKPKK